MLDSGSLACNKMIERCDVEAENFICESEFKIEETSSYSRTSMTSMDVLFYKVFCGWRGGQCGLICVWRNLWPKFGRIFNYGHVDTTNLVERD